MNLRTRWKLDSRTLEYMDVEKIMTWRDPCHVCKILRRNGAEPFCSNFLKHIVCFSQCLVIWCRSCYQAHPDGPFSVQETLGEEEREDLETDELLDRRLETGRDGDHLMGIPFECDLCHSRNVAERDPISGNARENFTLLCIRQACLDAMWSQETIIASGNFQRLHRDYQVSGPVFSIRRPVPVIGTDKAKDRACMGCTLMTLNASH